MKARLRFLWDEVDSTGAEILSGCLLLAFAFLLVYQRNNVNSLAWAGWFGAYCALMGSLQLYGVVWQQWRARLAGAFGGSFFLITLAGVFLFTARASITWLPLTVLAIGQFWNMKQVYTGARDE